MDFVEQPRYKPVPLTEPEPAQPAVHVLQDKIDVEVHSSLTDEWHSVTARVDLQHNTDGYTTVSRSFAESLELLDTDGFPKFIARMIVKRDSECRVIIPKVQLRFSNDEILTTDLAVSNDADQVELVIGRHVIGHPSICRLLVVHSTTIQVSVEYDEGVPPEP